MFLSIFLGLVSSRNITVNISQVNHVNNTDEQTDTLIFPQSCYFLNFNTESKFCKDQTCSQSYDNQMFQGPVKGPVYLKGKKTLFYVYYDNSYSRFDHFSETNCSVVFVSSETITDIDLLHPKTTLYQTAPSERIYAILNVTQEKFELAIDYDMTINVFSVYKFCEVKEDTSFLRNSINAIRFGGGLNLTKGLYHFTFYSPLTTSDSDDFLYMRPKSSGTPLPLAESFNLDSGKVYTTDNMSMIYIPKNLTGKVYMAPFQGDLDIKEMEKEKMSKIAVREIKAGASYSLKPGAFYRVTGEILYEGASTAGKQVNEGGSTTIFTYPIFAQFENYQGFHVGDQITFDYSTLQDTLVVIKHDQEIDYTLLYSGFSGLNSENASANKLSIYKYTSTPEPVPFESFTNSHGTFKNKSSNLIFGVEFNESVSSTVAPNNIIVQFYNSSAETAVDGITGGSFSSIELTSNITEVQVLHDIIVIGMSFNDSLYRVRYRNNEEDDFALLNETHPGLMTKKGALIRIGKAKPQNEKPASLLDNGYQRRDILQGNKEVNPNFIYQSISINTNLCSQLDIVVSSKPYWYASSTSNDRNASIIEGRTVCAWLIPFNNTTFTVSGRISSTSSVKIVDGDKTFGGNNNQSIFKPLSGTFNVSTTKKPKQEDEFFKKKLLENIDYLDEDYLLKSTIIIVDTKDVLSGENFVIVSADNETVSPSGVNIGDVSLVVDPSGAIVSGKNIPEVLPNLNNEFPGWAIGIIVAACVVLVGSAIGFTVWRIRRKKLQTGNEADEFQLY